MTKQNRNLLFFFLVLYVGFGLYFDYQLFRSNAPSGVKYSPTISYIFGWPVYLFESSLNPFGANKNA